MAPASAPPTKGATSGIITNDVTGERHIPASTRADGSTRREIRVRPGYRPPEDVEVYRNRTAEAWKNRGSGGVPGAETAAEAASTAGSTSNAKNAKRREARRRAKGTETSEADRKAVADDQDSARPDAPESQSTATPAAERANGEAGSPMAGTAAAAEKPDQDKQARKLRKKLREARELQEKKDKGEALLQEQFDKVIKINELIRDLNKLGFDADGNAKADVEAIGGSKVAANAE